MHARTRAGHGIPIKSEAGTVGLAKQEPRILPVIASYLLPAVFRLSSALFTFSLLSIFLYFTVLSILSSKQSKEDLFSIANGS